MKFMVYIIATVTFGGMFACNTTSKQEGDRQGADLLSRRCYELTQEDCYRAPHCRYDSVSYSCVENYNQGNGYGYQSNCSYYTSEYNCPRSTCRWTGYSCVDLNNGYGNTQSGQQCQFYNNDPAGCQSRGCLYVNGMCQMNPNGAFPGGTNVNCFSIYQPGTCAATPGCQWLNNTCQNRY